MAGSSSSATGSRNGIPCSTRLVVANSARKPRGSQGWKIFLPIRLVLALIKEALQVFMLTSYDRP